MAKLIYAQFKFYNHASNNQKYGQLDGDTDLGIGLYRHPDNLGILGDLGSGRDDWLVNTWHGPITAPVNPWVTITKDALSTLWLAISIRPRGAFPPGIEGHNTWQYFDVHMRLYWDDNSPPSQFAANNHRLQDVSELYVDVKDMDATDHAWGATKEEAELREFLERTRQRE